MGAPYPRLTMVLRIGTRYRYETIRGLKVMSQQNLAHFVQCPLGTAAQLAEIYLTILFSATRNQSQKKARLEGYTASLAAPVDAKHPCWQEKRRILGPVINTGGRKCHCLPHSQSCGKLNNGGTIGGWFEVVGGGLVVTLMFMNLSSVIRGPP